jgi:hypothetical protein
VPVGIGCAAPRDVWRRLHLNGAGMLSLAEAGPLDIQQLI